MYRLISAKPSPFARRARLSLREKGLPFTLETEVPWDETTTTPDHNPLEKLPILLGTDFGPIYDSQFILEYLETIHPTPSLVPTDRAAFFDMRRLEVLGNGICDAFVLLFFERQRDVPSKLWMARQRRKIDNGIAALAKDVGTRDWAIGEALTRADIAIVSALSYLTVRDPSWDWAGAHPRLERYRLWLEEREAFRDTYPAPQVIEDEIV